MILFSFKRRFIPSRRWFRN